MMVAIQAPGRWDANADTYCYCHSHGYANGNCHANGNSDCHSAAHSDTEIEPVAETSPNSSAAPLALLPRHPGREAKVFPKCFLLLSRARERNYHLISARLHPNQENPHYVKDNPYLLRAAVSSVFRKQLGELRSTTEGNTLPTHPPGRFRK